MGIHTIAALLFFISVDSQKCSTKTLEHEKKCEIETKDENETVFWFTKSIPNLVVCSHYRVNEYFTDEDTLKRDYIRFGNAFFVIDELIYKNRDYTINFELNDIYLISCYKYNFIIISGYNTFQMGTDQQKEYLIFRRFKDRIEFYSSYLLDSSELDDNSVKVVKRRKTLKLKSIGHKKLIKKKMHRNFYEHFMEWAFS